MRRAVILPVVLVGLGAATASAQPVTFEIVSQSAVVDKTAKTATFTLAFNQTPNFALLPGNVQANAFQYEIDTNWSGQTDPTAPLNLNDIFTVVRGAEISSSAGLPLREATGNGGPNAGGWGPARDVVPFDLSAQTLSFTAPLDSLGDADGVFRYRVFATDHGAVTSDVRGAVIPLPAALWTGITVLTGLGITRRIKRRVTS
jgi:hypothetical protein